MREKTKTIINAVFLVLCILMTCHFLFQGKDIPTLLRYMHSADPKYWMPGALLVVLFIMSESVIMRNLLMTLGEKVRLTRCFLYSFTGFFFCLITPGASGGQPVQLLMMKKDGIAVHVSTPVLLMITIAYKAVLLIFSATVFILRPARLMLLIEPVMGWIMLGLILTCCSIGMMLALIWQPLIVGKLASALFSLLRKIMGNSRRISAMEEKLMDSVAKYGEVSGCLMSRRGAFPAVLLMTAVQRTLLFSVSFLVLLSFGITELSYFDTVLLQSLISTGTDMLPVPGGMGMNEHLYSQVFRPVCGEELTLPSLIITRGLTYYTQLIISAVMTAVAWMKIFGKKKRSEH